MGDHAVQFFEDEAFLLECIEDHIVPPLQDSHACIVIAQTSRLSHLKRLLAHHGIPSTSYVSLDAETLLAKISVNGTLNEDLFRQQVSPVIERMRQNNRRDVYIYGELVAMLCARGNRDAAIQLEEMWNTLAEVHEFSLLCAYPISVFSDDVRGDEFLDICNAHCHVRPAETRSAGENSSEVHRTIALLQQKTAVLETEAKKRERTQECLRQRELELSDVLENTPDAMCRVSPNGLIIWANQAELEMLGYLREEYIGHHIAEFHVGAEAITDVVQRILRGESLHDYPAQLRCKDGSIKHVLIRTNAFLNDGEFVSTRCLTRDITERMQLEEELDKKLKELADLDRMKNEFLAMLGHELRNPLAPVMTSLELMRLHESDTNELRRLRDIISRQVALVTRLMDDLLDSSRITRGKIELQHELAELHQMHGRPIKVYSEGQERDSAFAARLPLSLAQSPATQNDKQSQEEEDSGRLRHILIVDDNIDAADSLAEYLKALDHTVHVAYDGRSALHEASLLRPDTVILDIGMPDMNGYQVAQLLRSEVGLVSSTLIAVSGYAQESDRMASHAAGFDHHFAKPLDIPRLMALLRRSA